MLMIDVSTTMTSHEAPITELLSQDPQAGRNADLAPAICMSQIALKKFVLNYLQTWCYHIYICCKSMSHKQATLTVSMWAADNAEATIHCKCRLGPETVLL